MAINNVNEFLRKTFSKTIFGTPALRPIAVCADGFNLSIQASSMHYCRPSMNKNWLENISNSELYIAS